MSDDGASFTIDIPVTGTPNVDAAAASVDALAVRLGAASKAALASSDAIKAGEAAYGKAERAANNAAKALERIGVSADAQKGKLQHAMDVGDTSGADKAAAKLQSLTARQADAASKAMAAKAALEGEATALDKIRASATAADAAQKKLKDDESKKSKVDEAGDEGVKWEMLDRGLGKIGGPIGAVGQKVAGLMSGFGKLGKSMGEGSGMALAATAGFAALAAAVIAVAVATVEGVTKFIAWTVGLSDANAHARLLAQGIAQSVAGGTMLNDEINSLTATLPLTQDELQGMAKRLAATGLQGKALTNALDDSATAAARLKFGPDFAKEMLSLDQQSKVFHASLAGIFGGLKTDGLMGALQTMIRLFDANTASGRAIKVVFESLFQPIIDKVAAAGPMVERFFLQLEIWALKAMIAIKPYGWVFGKIGTYLKVVAAVVGGTLVVAFALMAAQVAASIAVVVGIVTAVEWYVDKVTKVFGTLRAWFQNFSLADMGKAMIDGLIAGIMNGGAALLSAISGTVGKAVDAAKKALGIASPSKVFAEIGMQTGAGMEQGVDRSSVGVRDSLESMVSPSISGGPTAGSSSVAPAASSGKGSGTSFSFDGAQFIFHGVDGAEDAEERFKGLLTRVLEGDAAQIGAMATNPAT